MHDRIDAAKRLVNLGAVADVADDQLGFAGKIRGACPALVHLRIQIVEDAHPVAAAQQFIANMGSDEAGPPRDQNMHRSTLFLF